ncbi:MAG: hypothetical protein IKF05_05170 [Erysipelotrichaceae bacterium]|nr:hypothetical protein [Erysipelotrichaceae bacterium]
MKRYVTILSIMLMMLTLFACRGFGTEEGEIRMDGFKEFYYTYENINYNAKYQRYYFYEKDGKHMFFHDRREVIDDYGPAGEADRNRFGEFELTEEEWQQFASFLQKGTARNRQEHTESGDSGPWMFLYREGKDPKGQEFEFDSYSTLKEFEQFCDTLADTER